MIHFHVTISLLSTEWVDYVKEPMKYQALRPHFFSMGGWGLWIMMWVVGWCGHGMGGGGAVSGWCSGEGCCGWWREGGWWHG